MSLFLYRLHVRATAYQSALNELGQLVAAPPDHLVRRTDEIHRLAGDLRHSRASRLQLAVTDTLLRHEVGQQLQRLGPKPPRDYFKEIRGNPAAIRRLAGFWGVRSRLAMSVQSDVSVIDSLWGVLLNYLELARKDDRIRDRTVAELARRADQLRKKAEDVKRIGEEAVESTIALSVGLLIEDIETQREAVAAAEEFINAAAACVAEAGKRQASCKSQCAPGPPGGLCRVACDAAYLLDVANCATG